MGGIEDSECPLKRLKASVGESNSFVQESSRDHMASLLLSQEGTETVGSKGIIKRNEFVKVITRALYSLGYEKTGALLEEESGLRLFSSEFNLFVKQVTDGKWDDSIATLHKIDHLDETTIKSVTFLLLEQKFIDLLRTERVSAAIDTLRNEIVPLRINVSRVHDLASFVISPSRCASLGLSCANTSRSKILEELQKLLPACVTIPEKRLEHLVQKALEVQRDTCRFHNALDSDLTLYSDHNCGRNQIPSETLQVLQAHTGEVWFVQFSHRGKYLASSSKDQTAIVWEVSEVGHLTLKHRLSGHQKPVLYVSWSPDDKHLLTCGEEEVIRCWDVNSGECLHIYEKSGIGLISCSWFPDGKGIFATGLTDKSICLWDLHGKELACWDGQRTWKISDIAVTSDGKRMISIYKENVIQFLDREAKVERVIGEKDVITSFTLSKDEKFLLVNLINQEIHLWSLDDLKVVSRYKGHKRARFVIRSCFGGFEQTFIASGSEDSQVYIWHRYTEELLLSLPGHSGAVNCVSWNPANIHMLASASDDGTIRIWGLHRLNTDADRIVDKYYATWDRDVGRKSDNLGRK